MSRFILSLAVLGLIVGSCGNENSSSSVSSVSDQKSDQSRAVVSIVPVIDSTKNEYAWNLSDELSSTIYERLAEQEKFNIVHASRVRAKTKKLQDSQNPFGPDISWVKKAFQGDDFVVFMELVEHEEILKQSRHKAADPQKCSADLKMSMRVRVFDLRGNEPKIILQELLHDKHYIPWQFTQFNFNQVSWGDTSFHISPVGLAHEEFTKEIALRLEDYILMAQKR